MLKVGLGFKLNALVNFIDLFHKIVRHFFAEIFVNYLDVLRGNPGCELKFWRMLNNWEGLTVETLVFKIILD